MDEKELKEQLQRDVPNAARFEALWRHLKHVGRVNEVLVSPDFYEDLVSYAREANELQLDTLQESGYAGVAPGPEPGQPLKQPAITELGDYEREHALAQSAYVARWAAKMDDVRDFREGVMGGELLTQEEADRLVTSPAAAILTPGHFINHGIPLRDHGAEVVDERCWKEDWSEEGTRHYSATVRVSPPSVEITVRQRCAPDAREVPSRAQIMPYVDSDGNSPVTQVLSSRTRLDGSYMYREVPGVRVVPLSLLGTLREVGKQLARRYPWLEAEAVRFVLTGEPPWIPPLTSQSVRGGFRDYGADPAIIITAAAYTSAETVRRLFLQMQHQVGGRAQQERAKGAAVLGFVLQQVDSEGDLPPWSELLRRWNAAHPKHRYTDESGIRKQYERAYQKIIAPLHEYIPL